MEIEKRDASVPHLRPMGLGGIIDTAIRLYRKNLVSFFCTVLAAYVLLYLWTIGQYAVLRGQGTDIMARALTLFLWSLGGMFIWIVVFQLCSAALTVAVSRRYLGQSVGVREAFGFILRQRFWKLIGAVLLASILIFLGSLLLVVPGIYLAIRYALVSEVVVLEGLGGMAALRRSTQLMKEKTEKGFLRHNYSKVILLGIFVGILSSVFGVLAAVPKAVVAVGVGIAEDFGTAFTTNVELLLPMGWLLLLKLVELALSAFVQPIGMAAFVLFYYDIRVRWEGFDLELLSGAFQTEVSG